MILAMDCSNQNIFGLRLIFYCFLIMLFILSSQNVSFTARSFSCKGMRLETRQKRSGCSCIDEIVRESKIEEKLANLEVLAASCKAKCEKLGVTDGYVHLGLRKIWKATFTLSLALTKRR
ncbi:unnamed protein product [Cylicocyclus nassatus]|uniref:Transmembrane protein n=1 Tax=Cylicocyclus nassatus TaxID=53992 RepID=A0AA36MCJ6_CYLNA|nr:unnamed protein product [Cylicocyclus nassatus]